MAGDRVAGFTLIEVVVALAVFSIGAAGALLLITRLADATTELETRTFADWVAQNRVAEAELFGIESLPSQGHETMAGRDWLWQRRIDPAGGWQEQDRIEILVTPESGGDEFERTAPLQRKPE
ncbi:MAG: type II secretion system minor pseudopilin GspI [Pseudomonadota bacterium]|nr:type II secretion system minor pseudopilin GspI [Pseudomonadota bacterium]